MWSAGGHGLPDFFDVWSQPALVQNPGQKSRIPLGVRGLVGVGVVGDGAEGGVGMTGADKRVGVGSLMGFEMLV